MRRLIAFGVQQPVLMHLLFVGLVLYGLFVALPELPVDRYPNLDMGEAYIVAPYPGASPEQIETEIIDRLEDALRGMQDIDYVRSTAIDGRGEMWVKFVDDTDYATLYDELRLRILGAANRLPSVDGKPVPLQIDRLEVDQWMPLIQVHLVATDAQQPLSTRHLALLGEELRTRLERIHGVKKVQIDGAPRERFDVALDPAALERHGATFAQVTSALRTAGASAPAGVVDGAGGEIAVRIDARFRTREAVLATIVRRDGDGRALTVVDLIDPAATGIDGADDAAVANVEGADAVTLRVLKRADANAIAVKDLVMAEVAGFERERAGEGMRVVTNQDSAIRIADTLGVLTSNLVQGVILVIATLVVFLTWRSAFLATFGEIFAVFGTLVALQLTGYSLNELTLLGLILVSGILVDDAIVVLDNVQRHRDRGKPMVEAVVDGAVEVAGPIVCGALATAASFLPLFLMTGAVGDFFALIPVVVCTALAVSLFECIFLMPRHALDLERIAGPAKASGQDEDELGAYQRRRGLVGWTARAYDRLLRWNLAHPIRALSIVAFLLVAAVGVLVQSRFGPEWGIRPLLKMQAFPDDTSILNVSLRMPAGRSLADTDRTLRAMARDLAARPEGEIQSAVGLAGFLVDSAYRPVWGRRLGVLFVELPELDQRSFDEPNRLMASVRADLESRYEKDGVEIDVAAQKDGPPTGSAINVRVSGIDEAVVERLSAELLAWLAAEARTTLRGVVDLQDDGGTPLTELHVATDWSRLADHGISQSEANAFIAGALDGAYVGDYWRSDGDIPLRVTLTPSVARDPALLARVPLIDDAQGRIVRFADLGSVTLATGPSSLSRRDFQRSLTITGNLAEDAHLNADNVVDAVERWWAVHGRDYPGANVAFGGETESTGKSYGSLIAAFFLSLFLVFALLAVQFRSYAQPLLIMSNVVFAFIGVALTLGAIGLAAMLLPEGWVRSERAMFTVESMIAIVALTGMVVNEDIVLIDFINRRRAEGRSVREALLLAGHQRLRAVLMTTLTTIAGLIAMAIGLPFSIKWSPMATCFVAGLTVSSAMTLLIVPVLYELMDRIAGRVRRLMPERLRSHD